MTKTVVFFALVTDPLFGGPPASRPFGGASALVVEDVLSILATGFTLALLLVLWARFGRSRRRPGSSAPASATALAGGVRRRRRRRAPLARNPTRAETGGLPPIRTDGPPRPSS